MGLVFSLYTVFYLTAAGVSVLAAVFAWRRRSAPGGVWLFAMSVCTTVWALAVALDYSSTTLEGHVFWAKASYLGATTAPAFLLLFVLAYTGRTRWTRPWVVVALLSVPLLAIAAAYTNELHRLVWPGFRSVPGQANLIIYEHGPAYWAVTVYGLILGAVSSAMLLGIALRARALHRRQSATVAIAVMIPWTAHLAYSLLPGAFPGFDPSVTVAFTGAALTFTMLGFKLLDVVPVPREVLVEEMSDGMLVLDREERVLEINPAGLRLLGVGHDVRTGEPFSELLVHWPEAASAILSLDGDDQSETCIRREDRHVGLRRLRLSDDGHGLERDLYVLRDMTAQVHAESALQDAVSTLSNRVREIEALQAELQEQAIRDPLTGLHNRRYLVDTLERELGRASREGYEVSLVMFDVDHFKQINDALGHAAGDLVLRTLGAELRSRIRIGDIACRYGGDEFLVVLPNTSVETAVGLAERWRLMWRDAMASVGDARTRSTISLGVASFPLHARLPEELIAAADSAVYASKAGGRDRTSVAQAGVIDSLVPSTLPGEQSSSTRAG